MEEEKFSRTYQSGQKIPRNVMSALLYISKVGFMTTAHWHRGFGKGKLRWQQKQLKSLVDKKLIRKHTSASRSHWVLSQQGEHLTREAGFPGVTPACALQFAHDEFVGESLLKIEGATICKRWMTEAELKNKNAHAFQLETKDKKMKFPDALFQVKIGTNEHLVALEYERVGKSFSRYVEILRSYQRMEKVELIIYVVENNTIKKMIQRAMEHLGGSYIDSRVVFAEKEKWKEDPANCPLEFKHKTITLAGVCSLYR